MQGLLDGAPYTDTGLPPFFAHEGGSFANGGAMRISPLAIALCNSSTSKSRANSGATLEEGPGAFDSAILDSSILRASCAEAVH